jgi:hypothetical protein
MMRAAYWLAMMSLTAASPAAAKCHFDYSAQVEEAIVEPAFTKAFGANRFGYDPHKPGIEVTKRTVELRFQNLDPRYLDTDIFVVIIENCGAGPVHSDFVSWRVEAPKGRHTGRRD